MEIMRKRLLFGLALGVTMSAVVWLNISETSPAYAYLLERPRVGHSLLVLNLPALLVSRVLAGTPPAPLVVYLACFVQWLALGIGLSFAIWRTTAQPGASSARSARW